MCTFKLFLNFYGLKIYRNVLIDKLHLRYMTKKRVYGTISLPTPLIDSVRKKIEGTGIHSVSAYVCFILRQILSSPETKSSNQIGRAHV